MIVIDRFMLQATIDISYIRKVMHSSIDYPAYARKRPNISWVRVMTMTALSWSVALCEESNGCCRESVGNLTLSLIKLLNNQFSCRKVEIRWRPCDVVIMPCISLWTESLLIQIKAWCLCRPPHDDVIKWKHFPRYWLIVWGIHRWPVNSPHKGQWRGALMFTLICAWTNCWVNNPYDGDLGAIALIMTSL